MSFDKIMRDLKNWWHEFTMTPDERWLSQSKDVVELESKLRKLWSYNNHKFNF